MKVKHKNHIRELKKYWVSNISRICWNLGLLFNGISISPGKDNCIVLRFCDDIMRYSILNYFYTNLATYIYLNKKNYPAGLKSN